MPTLTRKFGYAPAVAILAENDIDVRAVVCAEFGYRADEQWIFTPQGTAALYAKDVHSLIANNCHWPLQRPLGFSRFFLICHATYQ